jgi:MYXO-CTERM domain-containing protein
LTAIVYSPRDGETNVPTNAVIDIHVFAEPIPSDIANQFTLWLSSTQIGIQQTNRFDTNAPYITAIRLVPSLSFLNPGQTYQVRQGASSTGPILATFTTGSSPDYVVPPPMTGASASVNGFDTHPDGGSDCFTERIRQLRINVPDVGKPVVYTIKEGSQTISVDDSSVVGSFYCSGQPHWQGDKSWVVAPGQHTLQVSAVDRVGHASTPVDVTFNANCDGGSPDGGNPGGGNGSPDGTGTPVRPTPTSCSCGTGVGGALALSGLAMILRARRRNHASDSSPT